MSLLEKFLKRLSKKSEMKKKQNKSDQETRIKAYGVVVRLIDATYRGDASDATQEKLVRWFRSDVNEEIKFDAFEQAMHHYLQANDRPDKVDRREFEALKIRLGLDNVGANRIRLEKNHTPQYWRIWGQIAAVLLPLLLFAGISIWVYDHSAVEKQQFAVVQNVTVQSNENKTIVLDDGTEVTLNEGSEFSYNDNRECTLKGEGYFKVAKADKPFVVRAENIDVTVLGTEFNLCAYSECRLTTVTLYSGSVSLDCDGSSYKLEPGKIFTYDSESGQTSIKAIAESSKPLWMKNESGSRVYPLEKILQAVEERYNVTIVNKQIPDLSQSYTFMFKGDETVDAVMAALKIASGDFDYKREGNIIIIESIK